MAQVQVCDNCRTIQPTDPSGWFLLHELGKVPAQFGNPIFAIMGMPAGDENGEMISHIRCDELCSIPHTCLVAYAQNGFQSTFQELFESEVPSPPVD